MDAPGIVITIGVLVIIALVVFGVHLARKEQREWKAFKISHNCKIVGKMAGSSHTVVAPVISGNGSVGVGVGVGSVPSKTGWLCDDGITYWRNG